MSYADHPRDRARDKCCPMPGVVRGPFVVYLRTDGFYVVVDPRKPLGRGTVSQPGTLAKATRDAAYLASQEP